MVCDTEKQIRTLLKRYFAGMTTLDEERLLREYFSVGEGIPDDLRYAQALFGVFHDAMRAAVPDRHGSRRKKPSRTSWIWAGAAAAAIAALLTLTFVGQKESAPHAETIYCHVNSEPVTDYETAARYTENTLALISGRLKQFGQIVEAIESISQRDMQETESENK